MAESKESGVVKRAVWGAVATALVTAVVGWLTPAGSWLKAVAAAVGTYLAQPSDWPNWIPWSLSVFSAHCILRLAFQWVRMRKDSHRRFNQLRFLGALWRFGMSNQNSDIRASLAAFCPSCDGRLVSEEIPSDWTLGLHRRVRLICERCNATRVDEAGDASDLIARVSREVDRLIRTGEWRQHVPPGESDGRPR